MKSDRIPTEQDYTVFPSNAENFKQFDRIPIDPTTGHYCIHQIKCNLTKIPIEWDDTVFPTEKWKEGNVLSNDALNTFYFTVIWRHTYGKGPLR